MYSKPAEGSHRKGDPMLDQNMLYTDGTKEPNHSPTGHSASPGPIGVRPQGRNGSCLGTSQDFRSSMKKMGTTWYCSVKSFS